jgi:hypothetical protein
MCQTQDAAKGRRVANDLAIHPEFTGRRNRFDDLQEQFAFSAGRAEWSNRHLDKLRSIERRVAVHRGCGAAEIDRPDQWAFFTYLIAAPMLLMRHLVTPPTAHGLLMELAIRVVGGFDAKLPIDDDGRMWDCSKNRV